VNRSLANAKGAGREKPPQTEESERHQSLLSLPFCRIRTDQSGPLPNRQGIRHILPENIAGNIEHPNQVLDDCLHATSIAPLLPDQPSGLVENIERPGTFPNDYQSILQRDLNPFPFRSSQRGVLVYVQHGLC
jgi:hypothetical protein